MRVLVVCHDHPRYTKGGAELAAWHLFAGINAQRGHQAWFLARAPQALLHLGTEVAALNRREFLFAGEASKEELSATVALGESDDLARLLLRLKPDVVHFHHYYKVGLELIRLVKQLLPAARIALTLHEFIAICLNHGTMVKTDLRLCHAYSPRDCQHCFPLMDRDFFFLREQYIKSFFALVDGFVSPSHFLAQRYLQWGLPEAKMHLLENGIPAGARLPARALAPREVRGRFAFFGQMHAYKGIDVVIEALAALPKAKRRLVSLDVYGHGLELFEGDYRDKVDRLLREHRDFVHFHGPYEQEELPRLMAETDWVVMGSIWWENSPLVIQEAYKFGRPVICPALGGMAEKVPAGVGGLHYRARDAVSLQKLVLKILAGKAPLAYDKLLARLPDYTPVELATKQHLALYRTLAGK